MYVPLRAAATVAKAGEAEMDFQPPRNGDFPKIRGWLPLQGFIGLYRSFEGSWSYIGFRVSQNQGYLFGDPHNKD